MRYPDHVPRESGWSPIKTFTRTGMAWTQDELKPLVLLRAEQQREERLLAQRQERQRTIGDLWYVSSRILVVCLIALGLVLGINFLARQNWNSGQASFTCNQGQTLTWHNLRDGDTILHCK